MSGVVTAWLRVRLQAGLAWRVDWALGLLGDVVVAVGGAVMVWVLFSQAPHIEGYTGREVLVAWGLAEASRQVFWTVGRGVFLLNSHYIVGGALDRVLLRPASPLVQLVLEHAHLGSVPGVVWGLAVVGLAHPGPWTAGALTWVAVSVVCGAVILASSLLAWGCLGFAVLHRGRMVGLAHQLTTWAGYPPQFMPWPLALVMTTVLPFAFLGWIPSRALVADPPWWAFAPPLMAVATMAVAAAAWRWGLSRYGSSGT